VDEPHATVGEDKAMRMVDLPRDVDGFLTPGDPLGELSQFGETPGEPVSREDGWKSATGAEALVALLALEGLDVPLQELHGAPIVPHGLIQRAEDLVRADPEQYVVQAEGDGPSLLAQFDRAVRVAREPGAVGEGHADPSQPALVAQRLGECLGFEHVVEALRERTRWQEGTAGVEVKVDSLRLPLPALREMPQGAEPLLEAHGRLPIRRASHRLRAGLTEIGDGLLPGFALERVVGQALDVLHEPLRVEALYRLPDPLVECTAPLLEEASVGDLVG